MKEYIKPEMEITLFATESVITASAVTDSDAPVTKELMPIGTDADASAADYSDLFR